ncbi:radical SAM protein [Frankia sp. BMG5.23]|uniref:radical SAM protein n=1 Tax=Frankia sp. BMG5.23 TaxID=683305 RepID=UPI00046129C2|nr:radical SAM protein [Frankia sp. BMG5.23]KDA41417.1 hypothetical protein BMG523Draft_03735 [Frankia sp. BMG5.23]
MILNFFRRLHAELGVRKVTVGGGDPLTRPDVIDLLRGLRELDLRIHLDTVGTAFLRDARIRFMGNGTVPRIEPEAVARLVDLVGIPLDGVDDTIASFRRFGSAADQVECLSLLESAGARIGVNTVVHKHNIGCLGVIAETLANFGGIRQWQLFQFMPSGPLGSRNRRYFEIEDGEFDQAVKGLQELLPNISVTVKSNTFRKNGYLLIDGSGTVWSPLQNNDVEWNHADGNAERIVHGNIRDANLIERLPRD